MRVRYKTITVEVDGIKPTICSCCKKTAKPRGLHCHHIRYEFSVDYVREHPESAKLNTIYLCYACHRVGNCIRILEENKEKVKILERLMLS